MGRALLLTGRPGVGQTMILRSALAQRGATAGGLYTEEIREAGRSNWDPDRLERFGPVARW